jgi:hypothetical protein
MEMCMREWLLMAPKYGMYENHLRQSDGKSFNNLFRVDPESFNI